MMPPSFQNNAEPWEITPLAVATLPVPGWECLFGANDCSLRELTFWVWLLRKGDLVGVIDTGLPSGNDLDALNRANQTVDPGSVFGNVRPLENLLRDAGVSPEAIRFALVTQMVTYCTGGITPALLPNAHVYCAWDGFQELLTSKPGHPPREFYLTAASWNYFRDLLIDDRLTFASGPVCPAPGLLFEPTGGHHPGSAAVRVQTASGVVGILETAFVQENILEERPIGIAENAAQCREAIRRYRRECDLVIAGHEPSTPQLLERFRVNIKPLP